MTLLSVHSKIATSKIMSRRSRGSVRELARRTAAAAAGSALDAAAAAACSALAAAAAGTALGAGAAAAAAGSYHLKQLETPIFRFLLVCLV